MNRMIILTVALPLLTAFLLPTVSRFSVGLAKALGPILLLGLAGLVVSTWTDITANGQAQTFSLAVGNFAAPQGIVFYVDRLALMFAFAVPVMTLLMWPWYFADDEDTDDIIRKLSLTLLLVAASFGLSLSGDLFNLYVFYELLAVASYGLVAAGNIRGTGASYTAAFRYLMISAMGSVLALLGIALIYFQAGTLNLAQLASVQNLLDTPAGLAAFVLILLGFGVKAELFPVNGWVPEVYMATSKRVSGLLAGLVSKLAVLVIIKSLILVFPQEEARQLLLLLGMLSVLFGELAAFRAKDVTRMLSWSSIAQLGLVFVAFSIEGKAGMLAGIAVALHHLVAKPALFLIAERWGGRLMNLYGVARSSPIMAALFVMIALSMVGVPPLPGFWAKFLLLSGLAGEATGLAYLTIAIVLVMTVIEAHYLFRVINIMYDREQESATTTTHRVGDVFSAALLGLVLILATVFIQPVGQALDAIATEAIDTELYKARVLPQGGAI